MLLYDPLYPKGLKVPGLHHKSTKALVEGQKCRLFFSNGLKEDEAPSGKVTASSNPTPNPLLFLFACSASADVIKSLGLTFV